MLYDHYQKQGYLLEDFRLFHLKGAAGVRTEYHYHEFCKFVLLVSGSGSYWVEGRRYALQPGDAVLVGSGCIHKPDFSPDGPYERIIIYISPDFLHRSSCPGCDLTECFQGKTGHVLRSEAWSKLYRLATDLEQELCGGGYGNRILGNSLLLRLLVEVARELHGDAHQPKPSMVTDSRVQKIISYIDSHLSEDLSVELLAQRFYWSKYHMMRRFRAETGSSICHYITQRRLMLARELIARGYSATESCFRAGFGSYSAFTRTYGRFFGTTPTGRRYTSAQPMDEVE